MRIKCIILDDEPMARQGLEDHIDEVDFLELIGSFKNAMEANEFLAENTADLIFLDIKMPKISGIEFLESLTNPPKVIFTTAFREYAVEGFELEAVDYLVKPIAFNRFLKAVNKVRQLLNSTNEHEDKNSDWFFIKDGQTLTRIKKKDVLFVESLKDYVFIHTLEKRHMALLSLKQVEELLEGLNFMRVHRSYLVSLDSVEAMDGNLLCIGQHRIPVSKSSREEVYQKLVKGKLWKRG